MVHWGIRTEPAQHPDRLQPARRAHGLDGRRAPGGRSRPCSTSTWRRSTRTSCATSTTSQVTDGTVPDTVPYSGGSRPADPAWGSAYPLLAWYMYVYYGDRRILEEHYEGIKAWTDYLTNRAEGRRGQLLLLRRLGDASKRRRATWYRPSTTAGASTSSRARRSILGKTDEAVSVPEARLPPSARLSTAASSTPTPALMPAARRPPSPLPLYLDMAPENLRTRRSPT